MMDNVDYYKRLWEMSRKDEFLRRFEEIVRAQDWRQVPPPSEVLDMWASFVTSCEEGYEWSIYEYENEISIRDLIKRILQDEGMQEMRQLSWFQNQTAEIDQRFVELIRSGPAVSKDVGDWWRARVPPHGGREFAEDVKSRYEVFIEVRDYLANGVSGDLG